MTNEVEKLILKDVKNNSEIKHEEKVAYLAYKEIWKFILFARQYNFNNISIDFNCNINSVRIDSGYNLNNEYSIDKKEGIHFSINDIDNSDVKAKWNTFYGSNENTIKNILNTEIDIKLLFKLLYEDGFYINYLDDDDPMLVHIEITKYDIEKCIKSTLLRNKVLKLEM